MPEEVKTKDPVDLPPDHPLHHNPERQRRFFKSFEAKSLQSRSFLTQVADDLTTFCGSTFFLVFHVIFFITWILINTGSIKEVAPFDPYPFGFLTMVVSLEAIFLSIFVLVSQNRSSYINSIREEVHLRVNLIAEAEITKILEVMAEMRDKMGIKEKDPELDEMLKRIDTNYIERSIADQMSRASKPLFEQLHHEFPELLVNPIKKPFEAIHNFANGREEHSKTTK